ncbi:MAG: MotA/TolQ/ExbB proton channel family protein [Candidatus Solibacter usitatus]|nr:MotA/TolQ/ExbB proton channel family protein [Candidatus Solibacter usitatus]
MELEDTAAGFAERAMVRAEGEAQAELNGGLTSVATIAATAGWVGMIGTVVGIENAFIGCGSERSACMAAVVERISHAIVPAAFGLLTAIVASWFHGLLRAEAAELGGEMARARAGLVNELGRWGARANPLATARGSSIRGRS